MKKRKKKKKRKLSLSELLEEEENKKEEIPKKIIIPDNFNNGKNKEICTEIYSMIKTIEDYKKNKKKEAEKLKKELSMIEYNQKILKGEDILDPKNLFKPKYTDDNPEFKLIKEK